MIRLLPVLYIYLYLSFHLLCSGVEELVFVHDEPLKKRTEDLNQFFGQFSKPPRLISQDPYIAHTLVALSNIKPYRSDLSSIILQTLALSSWRSARLIACNTGFDDDPSVELHLTRIPRITRIDMVTGLSDKDRFRGVYPLAVATLFDEARHKEGIKRIRAALADAGYRQSVIEETLCENTCGRGISIKLIIKEGIRSVLSNIVCTISLIEGDGKQLGIELQEILTDRYCDEFLTKELLQRVTESVKNFLIRRGYADYTIEYHEKIDHSDGSCVLDLSIRSGMHRVIDYIGNHSFSRRELREILMRFGKSLPYMPVSLICDELIAHYRSHGYYEATVSAEEADGEVHCIIFEGKQRRVYKTVLINAPEHLMPLIRKIYGSTEWAYTKQISQEKHTKLIAMLHNAGYWNASIHDEVYTNVDGGTLTVTLDLSTHYICSLVTYIDVPEEILTYAPPIPVEWKNGMARDGVDILTAQFSTALRNGGYLQLQPQYDVIHDEHAGVVRLIGSVQGSSVRSYIRAVISDGATAVRPDLLASMVQGLVNAPYERKLIERLSERLRALGIFSRVSLTVSDIVANDSKNINDCNDKAVLLTAIDDAEHEIRTRVGMQFVGQNFGFRRVVYKIGGSWLWRNPMAKADSARIDFDYVRYRREGQLWYSWPWQQSFPIKTDIKIYTIRYDQPFVIGSPHVLYTAYQNGMLACISGRMGNLWNGCSAGLELVSIGNISSHRADELEFDSTLVDRQIPYLFCEPSILLESVDNKADPIKGYRLFGLFKGLFPLDLSRAICGKFICEAALYQPIGGYCNIALRARVGHIFNEDFERIMPIERFYLGGSYSLRGYEPDLAPPVNRLICEGSAYLVPVGGRSMVLLNGEFRLQLHSLCNGVLFADCGALEGAGATAIMPRGILGNTGFGLRIKTPVGPLRFDIGWKWHVSSGESPYMWYLTLGNAF